MGILSDQFDIFISYVRKDNQPVSPGDQGWVARLVETLKQQFVAEGSPNLLKVFFDTNSIREGQDWESQILTALRESRYFLAVLSPDYFASDWCRREWDWWTLHEMHRHCLRDGAAPIYYVTVDGFPGPKSAREIAQWIVRRNLRPSDPAAQDAAAIQRAVSRFVPRQVYDLRRFDEKALRYLAEKSLKEQITKLAAHARQIIGRAVLAMKSPTDLPDYNPAFTGRVQDLIELRRDLALGAAGITAVVHGLGGIGKTELALAYAHAYGHDYPGGRYIIPCAGVVDWRGALDRFADLHGWTFEDRVKMNLDLHLSLLITKLQEFAAERGRCLLLCDNVESPNLLRPGTIAQLRIRDNLFHLLFTTRLPAPPDAGTAANLHWHALDSLPCDEAVALLETIVHSCPPAERPSLAELATELGGFTIAVELTGRYLLSNPADTPSALLARLRASLLPELGSKAERTGRDLFRHGEEARLDFIIGQTLASLSPAKVRALEYAAELAPDALPLAWVRQLLATDFPEFAGDNIAADTSWMQLAESLSSLRLIMRNQKAVGPGHSPDRAEVSLTNPTMLATMHRLVQEVVRARYREAAEGRREATDKIVKSACRLLREHWHEPQHRWLVPVIEATADAWLTRSERTEIQWARDASLVAFDTATVLDHIAAWNRAEPLYRRAQALIEQRMGRECAEFASIIGNLAHLLMATNRHDEAEPLLRQALAIDEKNLRPDHPTVAIRLSSLFKLLRATNRSDEAEPLIRRALAIDEKHYGPDHPKVGIRLNNLGLLLHKTNQLDKAEPLLRRALEIGERSDGPDSPEVLVRLNNLGRLLKDRNRPRKAEPLMRRAVAMAEKIYGPDHPMVATTLGGLAQLLGDLDRHSEAEPLIRRAVKIAEKSHGPDHPGVATALNDLAVLLYNTKRYSEAEPLMRRALEIDEKSYGPNHPDVARDINNLSFLLSKMNQNGKVEPLMRRHLKIVPK
jgi:tetratricopeptide (TPR) repeat protein